MSGAYADFIERKSQSGGDHGFDPVFMPDFLFDFQKALVTWAVRKGRAAIFADCGLGKTPMQLTFAENVVRKTGKPVLILTPLAVASQTVREAGKFGFDAEQSRDGSFSKMIVVTNYQQLHRFKPEDFAGCICDESSILKNFDGATRDEICIFMRKLPYRLLATATAAPNDYTELGSSSDALGYLGHMDMLNKFFKNDQNNSATGRQWGDASKWRFKKHAELPFWRWVCSWARAVRKPSDIGFKDDGLVLPPLVEEEHNVEARTLADGLLFAMPASTLPEQREERRRTLQERCEKVAELVNHTGQPALVWCHLNPEGDLLEKLIPDSVQISGSDSDEKKESVFMDFADGKIRVLVTKPKIGAWGMNFQHCNHVTFFPSHSYEQYYQSVRRCWRFGQKRPVKVDIITTEGEHNVLKNLQAKAAKADAMFSNLVKEMNHATGIERSTAFCQIERKPSWL